MQLYVTPDGQYWVQPSTSFGDDMLFGDDDDDFAVGDDMLFGDDAVFGMDDDDDMDVGRDMALFGDDMLFGADRRGASRAAAMAARRAGMQRARARKIAQARAAGGFVVGKKKNVAGMSLMAPFNTAFTASQTQNVTIIPTRSFAIEELIVNSNNAGDFQLNTFSNGADNLFNAGGAINMQVFSEGAVRRKPIRGFTANAGVPIILNITNLVAAARTLSGMLVGDTVISVG